jgi:2-polyprenyl-3-methyl-5-hydroxy-6-metoxy-1,4-benzoquinol methylase
VVIRYMAKRLVRYAMINRINTVRQYLKGSVLDIGCGGAFLANFIPPEGYVGVDANESWLQQVKETKPAYKFHCINVDTSEGASKLASLDGSFDTITLLAVVEHLHHPQLVFGACSLLLKDEGLLVITTPTPLGDKIGGIAARLAKRGKKSMFPHVQLFTLQGLNELLTPLKFKPIVYRKFLFKANQLFVYSKHSGSSTQQ